MAQIFFSNTAGNSYREMSAAAHSLLRKELAYFFSFNEESINIVKDDKGCPSVDGKDDVFVSLSHSHGTVMCAFSNSQIGADIEFVQKRRKSVENRVFTDSEISLLDNSCDENMAFFRLWTLKESYLKAIGTGFAGNAKEVEFYSLEMPIKSNKPEYAFTVGECDGFIYSVCEKNTLK